jgi:hypothetical protein
MDDVAEGSCPYRYLFLYFHMNLDLLACQTSAQVAGRISQNRGNPMAFIGVCLQQVSHSLELA